MRFLTAHAALPLLLSLLFPALPLQAGPLGRLDKRQSFPAQPRPLARLRANAPSKAPTNLSDPAAQDLLKRMLQAENSLALTGDQITVVSRNGLDISSEQQVMRNGARALRLDYVRPPRLAGEEIIDNGRFYCHLLPAQDTLELSPSRIQTLRVRVPQVIKQIQSGRLIVQSVGQETVAGHPCVIVQVAARSATPVPSRRFWIDPTNGAQLRIDEYDAAGQLQSSSYYAQVVYNPVFDKGAFRLPHAGSKVVERGFAALTLTLDQVRAQAGFPVPTPAYLPDGFRFQAGSVSDARGRRVIDLRYVNGVNALSVFMTPDTVISGPSHAEHPRQGVLYGRQAGMKIVLIGNLGNGELEKVLTSLRQVLQ